MAWYAHNRKIYASYDIHKRYEAGISLYGHEVKAVRTGGVSLQGAYVTVNAGEVFLHDAYIPPYQQANTPDDYHPRRIRKLLLAKREIEELMRSKQPGLTIVPVGMYNKNHKIKVEIALVRGKKKHDKRESIKKKDVQRDLDRSLKKNIRL